MSIGTYLMGGLGNQMFQYAIARNIAILDNTDVLCNTDWYKVPDQFYFPLLINEFGIEFKTGDKNGWLIKEKDFSYNPGVIRRYNETINLYGYWQSEKYFYTIRDILKREFVPKKLSANCVEVIEYISSLTNPVFIHVRRNERENNAVGRAVHGLLGQDYYNKAIDLIKGKFKKSEFVIFSDDIEWVKRSGIYNDHIVPMELSPQEDLYVMSRCKHGIIANSSFSWWGAWLIDNPNKVIVAPDPWFKNKKADTRDLLSDGWIKIKTEYL